MKKIIHESKYTRQAKLENDRIASIYPIQYINAIDCSYQGYVEEFDDNLVPNGAQFPPCTNRGGIKEASVLSISYDLTPPTLEKRSFSCIVDYLSLTFNLASYYDGDNVTKIEHLFHCLGDYISQLQWAPSDKGLFGYKQSAYLTRNGLQVGLIGFDGNNDSCYVSLSGQGCLGVDMEKLRSFVEQLPRCKITRIDMAYDDLLGELSIWDYKKIYESGGFAIKGTAPKSRFIDDMGSNAGCTLYIGKKANGKESCIYEKGKQLGDPTSPWLRLEGRITAVDRIIPFECMTQPAQFLASLYPPFSKLSAIHAHIEIIKKHSQIALDNLVEYASIAYGKLINVLKNQGATAEQIVDKLIREGVPSRLMIPECAKLNLVPF